MVDAIVSSVLDLLKTTIIERGKDETELLVGVEDQVKKLKRNLLLVRTLLANAKEKKTTNDLVKEWLGRLKEAAYVMKNALDEWRTALVEKCGSRRRRNPRRGGEGRSWISKF